MSQGARLVLDEVPLVVHCAPVEAVRPGRRVLKVSAKTGDGTTDWLEFPAHTKEAPSAA